MLWRQEGVLTAKRAIFLRGIFSVVKEMPAWDGGGCVRVCAGVCVSEEGEGVPQFSATKLRTNSTPPACLS